MSLFFCALMVGSVLATSAQPSHAEDTANKGKTEILVDENAGTVSILINGETAVLIDADGLHVRDSIEYGGTIADMGRENAIPAKDKKEAKDEE